MSEIKRSLYKVWKSCFEQLNLKFIQNRRCQDLGELRDMCRRGMQDIKDYEVALHKDMNTAMDCPNSFGWYLDEIGEVRDYYEKYKTLFDEIDNQMQLWEILKMFRKDGE